MKNFPKFKVKFNNQNRLAANRSAQVIDSKGDSHMVSHETSQALTNEPALSKTMPDGTNSPQDGLIKSNTAVQTASEQSALQGVISMAAFAKAFVLELAETVYKPGEKKGKHKKVGEAVIACPTLADFGINAALAKNDDGSDKYDVELDEQGKPKIGNALPIYEDVRFDWLQSAIKLAVTVKVRNKFQKGTLKPGMELPEDFESLTAETARSGEALALRRDARSDFEAFLLSLDKNAAVVQRLGELFWNSNKVLGTVSPKYLEAIKEYSVRWVAQLDDAKKTRFSPKIVELNDSINAAAGDEEDLMAEGKEEDTTTQERKAA
jgi:hypothetical protein